LPALRTYNGEVQTDILLRGTAGAVSAWLMNASAIAGTRNLSTMRKFWSVKGSGILTETARPTFCCATLMAASTTG
jgi:hypothetical protein